MQLCGAYVVEVRWEELEVISRKWILINLGWRPDCFPCKVHSSKRDEEDRREPISSDVQAREKLLNRGSYVHPVTSRRMEEICNHCRSVPHFSTMKKSSIVFCVPIILDPTIP